MSPKSTLPIGVLLLNLSLLLFALHSSGYGDVTEVEQVKIPPPYEIAPIETIVIPAAAAAAAAYVDSEDCRSSKAQDALIKT